MTNLFTCLSNQKAKYLCALLMFVCVGVGTAWGTTSVTGTYKLVTSKTGIAAGDTVLLVNKAGTYALTGISTGSTKYGLRQAVTSSNGIITLSNADVEELKVETGYQSTGFSFKGTGDISYYLYWTSSNTLSQNETKSANTSWTLQKYSAENGMSIYCNADVARYLRYNTTSGQERFACYKTETGTLVNLYKKVYAVKYDKNGGGGSAMTDSSSPYTRNSSVTVLDCSFTAPDGKVFDKWNTKSDGSGKNYEPGDSFSAKKDVTLYAQWADVPCDENPSVGNASLNGSFF